MLYRVYQAGEYMAAIGDDTELIEATEEFEDFWKDVRENGAAVIGPPQARFGEIAGRHTGIAAIE